MSERRVVFYVSGFGVFRCSGEMLDINPTDYLVQQLSECQDELAGESFVVKFAKVSQVSAIDALQTLLALQSCYNNERRKDDVSIFLHLGVSGKAKEFTLEQFAYNEAEWDTPDTKGWIPGKQKVGPLYEAIFARIKHLA